jgi:hypothetical protein
VEAAGSRLGEDEPAGGEEQAAAIDIPLPGQSLFYFFCLERTYQHRRSDWVERLLKKMFKNLHFSVEGNPVVFLHIFSGLRKAGTNKFSTDIKY